MNEKNVETKYCDQIKDDLKAYADGELPTLRRASVRRHIARCPTCRAELSEMERITQLMKTTASANPASLTPKFRARLISAVEGTPADAPPAVPLWRRRPALVFAGGGTLVAASLVAFFMLFQSASSMSEPFTRLRSESISLTASAPASATLMYAQDYDESYNKSKAVAGETRLMQEVEARVAAPAVRATPMPRSESSTAIAMSAHGSDPLADTFIAKQKDEGLEVAGAIAFERKVHREASIGVAVDKLEETSEQIEEKVKALGGYVASNNLETDASGYKSAELVVNVPEKDFEKTLQDFAKMGNVVSKSVTGEDITAKLSDATSDEQIMTDEVQKLDARLKSENMSERRTGQKEAELREAKMQLARTRARLGLLRNMAALSTINVSLTQKAKKAAAAPQPGWLNDLRETNKAAGLAFQSAVRVPIVLCIWILAFSPLWVPLLLAYRWTAIKTARKPQTAE